MEQDAPVTSVHALVEDAQNTGIYCKTRHQKHSNLGEDAKTVAFAAFLPLSTHVFAFLYIQYDHEHQNAVRSIVARKKRSKRMHFETRTDQLSKMTSLRAVFWRTR